MTCQHLRTKTLETRRSKRNGLHRRFVCCDCNQRFTAYGGATAAEVEQARATLRAKGYLTNPNEAQ